MEYKTAERIQTSVLNGIERKTLVWLAHRQPRWVTSDMLTLVGVFGAALTGAGYALSALDFHWLWLSSFGLLVNWYGDSLDGTLARYCDKLYETVMKNKPADAQYLFTSSDGRPLRYLQQKHPGIDLLLIVSKPVTTETIYLCKTMGIPRLGAKTEGTSREAVKAAHDAGLIVSLWPTHKIEDFILGCYLGADYLCTDIPGETMKFMGEKMPWINVVY